MHVLRATPTHLLPRCTLSLLLPPASTLPGSLEDPPPDVRYNHPYPDPTAGRKSDTERTPKKRQEKPPLPGSSPVWSRAATQRCEPFRRASTHDPFRPAHRRAAGRQPGHLRVRNDPNVVKRTNVIKKNIVTGTHFIKLRGGTRL